MLDVFAVVADSSRRRILDLLSAGDGMLVGELVDATGLTQSNVSKHLRLLRQGGFVHEVAEGRARRYRVNPRALAPLEDWLAPYRRKWTGAIDALARHLDQNPTLVDPTPDDPTPDDPTPDGSTSDPTKEN